MGYETLCRGPNRQLYSTGNGRPLLKCASYTKTRPAGLQHENIPTHPPCPVRWTDVTPTAQLRASTRLLLCVVSLGCVEVGILCQRDVLRTRIAPS